VKVIYHRETDSLVITLREAPIRESDEVRPGVIADFGEDGGVVRSKFEVLRAPRIVEDAEQVQFATIGWRRRRKRGTSRPRDRTDKTRNSPRIPDQPSSQRSICVQKVA
jgi:uncharacterized protein YuzE